MKPLVIKNKVGSRLSFTNVGACLKTWHIHTKKNKKIDIVLGYKNESLYLSNPLYLGSTVGRFANRIKNGIFNLNGNTITLPQNENNHHLHGGYKGFSSKVWDILDHSSNKIIFALHSLDLEENYPSSLNTRVSYKITDNNELIINFNAEAEDDTVLNLTHHSYFNLNGVNGGNILNHKLKIFSDSITEIDPDLIPTGKFLDVSDTSLDFRHSIMIGKRINSNFYQMNHSNGYDHNYVINNYGNKKLKIAAELRSDQTGLMMHVKTDLPGIQFYSGNFLDGSYIGKGDNRLKKHSGLCLEPQYFPDSPNHAHFPSTILKKRSKYDHKIIYGISSL